jgi:hypothetical protein
MRKEHMLLPLFNFLDMGDVIGKLPTKREDGEMYLNDADPDMKILTLYPAVKNKLGGINRAVIGGYWFVLDPDIPLRLLQTYCKNPYENIENETWTVPSSNGKTTYTVTRLGQSYSCTCPGNKFRGTCKHVKSVQK